MRIFVTVGNASQPFDRLLRAVDQALRTIDRPFTGLCQHGPSNIRPYGLKAVTRLSQQEFQMALSESDIVITHAGVGSLASAMRAGHRPLVMPRLATYGELVNDHQLELFRLLTQRGMIIPVFYPEDIQYWLAKSWPQGTRSSPAYNTNIDRLRPILDDLRTAPSSSSLSPWAAQILRLLAAVTSNLIRVVPRQEPRGTKPAEPNDQE